MNIDTINIIKQMSTKNGELNFSCYSGLLKLLDEGREDIVRNIKQLINLDPDKYTPELFSSYFKDMNSLIKRYDKYYNKKNIQHEYAEQIYEEKSIAYNLGESDENPDN